MRVPQFVFLTDDGEPPSFGWRLVAGNRRPLGRGVTLAASTQQCREDVERVRRDIGFATSALVAADGRWSWRLAVDGAPLAASVRAYLRRVECARGLNQFADAVHRADPAAAVVRSFGPHALRGYGS